MTARYRSEVAHARRALEAKTLEIQAVDRAKHEFLAMLGHELRNPLTPILTALQLMELRGSATFERERSIITRQVGHVVRLVDDLLEVSSITTGRVGLQKSAVEMAEVLDRALETSRPLFEQRSQHLSVDVPPGDNRFVKLG